MNKETVCAMSRSSRAKTSLGMTSNLSVHEALNSENTMCEILLLLPPETLYKLILVSKRWLQIISSPFFRHAYLTKWKPSFQLIGFFICNTIYLGGRVDEVRRPRSEPSLPLLSTSSIGEDIESSGVLKKLGYYIDSSNGYLLCGRHPQAYRLWDLSTRKYHKLPRPKVIFKELCMSLVTEDRPDKGLSYKVIRAQCVCFSLHSSEVQIQTYSSKTNTWSDSVLTCPEAISLIPWTQGKVIKGVAYWYATGGKVAIYDSNNEDKRIGVIKLPKRFDFDERVLGESGDGCLQFGWSNKSVMEIWKLEKVSGVLQWNIQYKMRFKMMWRTNPTEAARYSTGTKETQLLAFLIQTSDSVYIRCDSRIFICNTQSVKVEEVHYHGRKSSSVFECCKVLPYFRQLWPSPSMLKETNIR